MMKMEAEVRKYIDAANKFAEISSHEGFQVFLDIIKDQHDPEAILRSLRPNEIRTLSEEYSYQDGRLDAVAYILTLPQQIADRAAELRSTLDPSNPLGDEEDEPKDNYK